MVPLFAAILAAVSVSPTPSPSPTPVPQIAHVVTSDRAEEPITKTTRVTYVVTRDQIERYGYRTVGDALTSVPGLQIENLGAIGSTVTYGIRGSSSAQVLVLVNGLPAPGSLDDYVDLGTFSTAGVARVEVVEGGGSTLYGTGAIGGIINIVTDTSSKLPPAASVRLGSFGDREFDAQAAGFSFERIVATNDYPIPLYSYAGNALPGNRENSSYEATTARYATTQHLGAVDATVNLSLAGNHVGAPGYYPYSVSSTSEQDEVDKDAELTFRTHGRQSTTTLQLGGTQQQIAFDCDEATDSSCFQASASLTLESRTSLAFRNSVDAGKQQLVYGVDLSRGVVMTNDGGGSASASSSAPASPAVTSDALAQTAFYAEDRVDFTSSVSAYGGLRGERDGSLGGEFSPSLGIETALAKGLSLKLNYATAFRAPNATELYYPGYGNPNLHPERAKVGDATIADDRILGGASLTWFTNRTNDLIVATLTSAQQCYTAPYVCIYAPENVDRSLMQGFTADIKTKPAHGIVTTLGATDLYTANDLVAGTRLPNDAVFTVNLGLQILGVRGTLFGGAGVSMQTVGPRGPVDPTQPLFFQPATYSNLNGFVELWVAPKLSLFLRGYNLGDERYAEASGYPMPGRSFAVELRSR